MCRRLPGLGAQVLIFPVLDLAGVGATASYRDFGSGYFLTERDMAYFARSYADGHDLSDPLLSPDPRGGPARPAARDDHHRRI
jgi:acetyl esterase